MIVESYEDVIVISGALRSNHWETVHTAISLMLKRHPTGVVIDCSGLTALTPDGAETFHDAMDFIRRNDARIIVAAVPDHAMEVLRQVPEVRSQLPIAPTVEEARRSLDLLVDEPEYGTKKKKKLVAPTNCRRVVVCLYSGTTVDEDDAAMRVASQISDSEPTEVHLVCALLVSRELPLEAPLPKDEASASHAIARARVFFEERGLAHQDRVERARDVASAIAQVVDEIPNVQLVLLPLRDGDDAVDNNLKLMRSVLIKTEPQVLFVRRSR